MSCTVVTAFYPIKSKFPTETYLNWGKTFLSLDSPIVLFTESSLIHLFKLLRGDKPIHIFALPFMELDTWKLYQDKWISHHTKDPEKNIHTPELYAIWAQKAFFVERAINMNPFKTDYFFWCDFGAFRDPNINKNILESFPTTKYLSKNKILLQAIEDLKDSDRLMKEDAICGEVISQNWNEVRLVGGLWGGGIDACLKWKNAYQQMLEKYFKADRFAGKDQIVMLSTYLDNFELDNIVKCTKQGIDEWFFLEHLLSSEEIEYKLNTSYIKPVVSVNIMGGLGNQLFQVCTAYAYARKMSGQLQILYKTENGNRPLYFDTVLRNFQKFIVHSLPLNLERWQEIEPTKYSDIGHLQTTGKYLIGYLQSSKYFYNDTIKQEIKNLVVPDTNQLEQIRKKYNYLINNKERVIVVHCRRTDYLVAWRCHGPLTGEYYKSAIDSMLKKIERPIFLLCGDDTNFWTEISESISDIYNCEWYLMPPEIDITTFYLLQQFQNFIMSNSTFIWWCVWLSNAKNVIAPSKWFGPEGPQQYQDIYEPSWVRI